MQPSEILGIEDKWDAFCFDRAVWFFGMELEGAINSINEKTAKATNTKREREVSRWLRIPVKYRSPSATGKGRLGDSVREEAGIKIESGSSEDSLLGGVRRGL